MLLDLLSECRLKPPFLGFGNSASFEGVNHYESDIAHYLECSPVELPGVWCVLGTFTFVALAFVFHFVWYSNGPERNWLVPNDGLAFEIFFYVVSFSAYVMFLLLILRYLWVWFAVHQLVRRLYWHPTRSSYAALRAQGIPDQAETLSIRVDEPPPSLTAVEACLEAARKLLRSSNSSAPKTLIQSQLAAWRPVLRHQIENAERALSRLLTAQATGTLEDFVARRLELQRFMANVSGTAASILEPAWRLTARPTSKALNDDGDDTEIINADCQPGPGLLASGFSANDQSS